MHTELISITEPDKEPGSIQKVAGYLQRGGLVAIPTETVYGLAANAFNSVAVAKIFAAKGRPGDNPLIVHIAEKEALDALVSDIPPAAKALMVAFWPGPLTLVFPKSEIIPDAVSAGLDTVAVRMPDHAVARAVIEAAGFPLAAPSANRSGSPSPTTAAHVMQDLAGKIAAVVDSGPCTVGLESTVVQVQGDCVRILRPGGITREMLEAVVGPVAMDSSVLEPVGEAPVASPGMKYKHYAPKANLTLLEGSAAQFAAYVNARAQEGTAALCFTGDEAALSVPCLVLGEKDRPEDQSANLFHLLREADVRQYKQVYARCPATAGLGLALLNRLLRAAAFEVIQL